MRVHFKPTTDLGKWSAWLIVALAILLGVFFMLVASGQRGGDTFFSNPILTVPMLIAATAGIAAFIVGLISVVKRKERSVAAFLAIVVGLFVIVFVLGEVIFPH
jgi:cytochrome bd-type quinol oxidase subunit 2